MSISAKSVEETKQTLIPPISKEYSSLFRHEGVNISFSKLDTLVNRSFKAAVDNFNKLNLSKTYCLSAYASYWIREELIKILTIKTLRKINWGKGSVAKKDDLKAFKNFFSILPLGSFALLEQRLFRTESLTQRKKLFRQYQPILAKSKTPFRELVQWRNLFAQKKGYPNYISYIRQLYLYQIPDKEYEHFVKNVDRIIEYCYSQLPKVENLPNWFYSRYNQPCLLCLIPFPRELNTEKVLDIVVGLYPQLKAFLPKIRIVYADRTYTRYLKERDLFKVSIRKNVNQRHKTISLVHELGHVIEFIDSFTNNIDVLGKGKYMAEKAALAISFRVLKTIEPQILQAYYMNLLQAIHCSLFELAIYTEPTQDYDGLYAQLFRKCFPCSSQRRNPLYLLDEKIVVQPLTSLAFTVASVNLLPFDPSG
jgi:hypothetical protein